MAPKKTTTTIEWSGSRGEDQRGSLEEELELIHQALTHHALESFWWDERVGSEAGPDGTKKVSGNFIEFSHTFCVRSNDPAVLARLTLAKQVSARMGRELVEAVKQAAVRAAVMRGERWEAHDRTRAMRGGGECPHCEVVFGRRPISWLLSPAPPAVHGGE